MQLQRKNILHEKGALGDLFGISRVFLVFSLFSCSKVSALRLLPQGVPHHPGKWKAAINTVCTGELHWNTCNEL